MEWISSKEVDEDEKSRTRSPSRLSRTALLARLGEISIVLHAGCGALDAKRRVC